MMNNVSLDTSRREFKNCIETNENEDTTYPSLWVRMKAILRRQFITMMEEGHLSMCYFHWIIKKLSWLSIGQNLDRQSRPNRVLGERRQ